MGYLHLLHLPLLRTIAACLEEALAPRVVGARRDGGGGDLARPLARDITAGRGGIAMMAISALDIALWDAVGKRPGCRCTGSGAISAPPSRPTAAAASAARAATG